MDLAVVVAAGSRVEWQQVTGASSSPSASTFKRKAAASPRLGQHFIRAVGGLEHRIAARVWMRLA